MSLVSKISELWRLLHYWKNHPLASRNLFGTVERFIRWQVGSRFVNYPLIVPWIGGATLAMERGMTGATMNYYCGLHEFTEMAFLLHFLRPEDLFLDIGANVGSYSVLASGVCKAHSLAVEPVPSTHARLLRNIALNELSDLVVPCRTALGSQSGMIQFTADNDTMNRVAPSGYQGGVIEVPVTTIDGLLIGFPSSIFWKVDVEGYEDQVFEGAGQAITEPSLKVLLLESSPLAVTAKLEAIGFSPYLYEPFSRTLSRIRSPEGATNCLWIRDLEFVSFRLRKADAFRVLDMHI